MMTELIYAGAMAAIGGIGTLIGNYLGRARSRKELETLHITNESLKLTNKKLQSENDNLVIAQWKELYSELKADFIVLRERYEKLEKELHDLQVVVKQNQQSLTT